MWHTFNTQRKSETMCYLTLNVCLGVEHGLGLCFCVFSPSLYPLGFSFGPIGYSAEGARREPVFTRYPFYLVGSPQTVATRTKSEVSVLVVTFLLYFLPYYGSSALLFHNWNFVLVFRFGTFQSSRAKSTRCIIALERPIIANVNGEIQSARQ
ncbi:hypothetical protein DFH11DRAFT_1277446 [Phellopilus nigrolimitatus]|nr:hypothetical protein DFH11DRAFT_1277446 [Phellopilus nigrolimitatus]